jgi:hypothetical protein
VLSATRTKRSLGALLGVTETAPALACILICIACDSHESPPQTSATAAVVDEAAAKTLALHRYRDLFRDKYHQNATDGAYHQFPPLTESNFNTVESSGDAWLVSSEPPTGLTVEARVAKTGAWVEIRRVSYVPQ